MDPLSSAGLITGPARRPGKTKLTAPILTAALGLAFLGGLWTGYRLAPSGAEPSSAQPCPQMAPVSRAAAGPVSFRGVVTGVSEDRLTLAVSGGKYAGATMAVTASSGTEIYALVPENEFAPPASPVETSSETHYERRDIGLAQLAAQDVVDVEATGEMGPGATLEATSIAWKMSIVGAAPETGKPIYSTEFGRLTGRAAAPSDGSEPGLPPPETIGQ